VAARKVQRAVKKRLQREAVAVRTVQREVKKRVIAAQEDGWSKQQLFWFGDSWMADERKKRAKATVEERELREAKKQKKRAAAEYELEWEACWGGSALSKRCRLPPAATADHSSAHC
jgi:hypothetical protein